MFCHSVWLKSPQAALYSILKAISEEDIGSLTADQMKGTLQWRKLLISLNLSITGDMHNTAKYIWAYVYKSLLKLCTFDWLLFYWYRYIPSREVTYSVIIGHYIWNMCLFLNYLLSIWLSMKCFPCVFSHIFILHIIHLLCFL